MAILASTARGADLERAQSLPGRFANRVFRDHIEPKWLPDNQSFWYRVRTGPDTHEFVLVDPEKGERRAAETLEELGLPAAEPIRSSRVTLRPRRTSRNGPPTTLRVDNQTDHPVRLFWVDHGGKQVPYGGVAPRAKREQSTYAGHVWLVSDPGGRPLAVLEAELPDRLLVVDGPGKQPSQPEGPKPSDRGVPSPDGKWVAWVERGSISVQNAATQDVVTRTPPFAAEFPLRGKPVWASDSSAFVVSSAADCPQRRVGFIESTPRDRFQPKLVEFDYSKPGDPLPEPVPVLVRLDEGNPSALRIDDSLFPTPFHPAYTLSFRWAPDSSEFYFAYNERGHQLYRILAVDAKTGDVRSIVEETSETFIDYTKKTWRHWLDDRNELLWMSERSGWCHLYRLPIRGEGEAVPVTSGEWPVRQVLHVDEEQETIWFLASGLRKEEDPYHRHLCRVGFDGSDFRQLTEGDGDHTARFSPNGKYFVDSWSRADCPPVHELRRSKDGSVVCQLEQADISQLLAAGWTMPERFVAKGRDGKTDIHGILILPSDFDPKRKYPVLEEVYAGPHSAFAPKRFDVQMRKHQLAELGFIVVQADGMGTNHRGKAFHDVCWKNLKDAGFPDRIAWMKEAAKSRPWMDLERVGIFGGSAGGQSAMRALLDHHDFYSVAVADCGCHDNRMDKVWWNEQWLGWPVDESYARNSNVEDAAKLQGDLLLIVGELDRNVDPTSTLQVVGALQRAGKSFDFMPIIGAGHGAAETPYGRRLRMEFLVEHLGGPR